MANAIRKDNRKIKGVFFGGYPDDAAVIIPILHTNIEVRPRRLQLTEELGLRAETLG
jgi:hypothetical protein